MRCLLGLHASLVRLRTIVPGARASDAKGLEGHARGLAGLGSVCAQAVVVLLVLNGVCTSSADAATVWAISNMNFPNRSNLGLVIHPGGALSGAVSPLSSLVTQNYGGLVSTRTLTFILMSRQSTHLLFL